MKEKFVDLVSQIESIESKFHYEPTDSGFCMPHEEQICDVPEFKVWLEEIKFVLQDIVDRTGDKYAAKTMEAAEAEFNGWTDRTEFDFLKNRIQVMAKNLERYYKNEEQTAEQKEPKVFISHASADKEYVGKIVDLLADMGLTEKEVFCTSYPGYDIRIGNDIFETLRQQFLEFDLYVIFVHSKNYYLRPVCLNEMGAAWALKADYLSILLPDFEFANMTGVVNNRDIAIKLGGDEREVKDKLNQLYDILVEKFSLTRKAMILWETKRDEFIQSIKAISPD